MQKPRLKEISVVDNYRFPHSVHAINACFGKNYKGYQRATMCPYDDRKIGFAWFPKLAIQKDGDTIAQDPVYGCINTLSADGTTIYESHSGADGLYEDCIRHVFVKPDKNAPYQFAGNFRKDMDKSTDSISIYEKVSDALDLSEWYYAPLETNTPIVYYQENN